MNLFIKKRKSKSGVEYVQLYSKNVNGIVVLTLDSDVIASLLDCKKSYLSTLVLDKEICVSSEFNILIK